MDRTIGNRQVGAPQRVHEATRRRLGARRIRLGQENGELVPAQPRQEVGTTQVLLENLRHVPQEIIPGPVAESIVHQFEPVEIEKQHRAAGPAALRPVQDIGQTRLRIPRDWRSR